MTGRALFAAIATAALLAGCATPAYVSPVEVTRFVGDQPAALGRGPITVRAAPGQENTFDLPAFQSAVATELGRLGYTVTTDDAPQVAEVRFQRATQSADRRSPVRVGGAGQVGSSGGSMVGLGLGVDLSGRPADRVQTELGVMIRPAAGGTALWEGRARFIATANSPSAVPQASATRLATALFAGFPGRSGETIEVR